MTTQASPSKTALALQKGGSAELIEAHLEHVALLVERASPPGSTLVLVVAGAPLAVKVKSCRRNGEADTRFRVEGRFVSLTRSQREALAIC